MLSVLNDDPTRLGLDFRGEIAMWADIDTKRDYLNYLEVAELVVDIVRDPAMRPVSVGIFGTWGTGKSTLLNLIEDELRGGKDDVIIIRFDAWLYQGYDDSRAALMEVIATRLFEVAKDNEGLAKKALHLIGRVNKLRALGMLIDIGAAAHGLPTFGAFGKAFGSIGDYVSGSASGEDAKNLKEGVKESKELLKPENKSTPPQEIEAFRKEFAELLDGLKKTLVVFVDNLDRCLPKQTIHTLEALRLFLFMDQTAFVVAADEEMVRHAVSQHFAGADTRHVTDYLDKLIQIPVRVPRLGVTEVRAYLFMLFASVAGANEKNVEALRVGLENNLRTSWSQEPLTTGQVAALLGDSLTDGIRESFDIADRMAQLLAVSSNVKGNPRIVKRMLNVVRMRSHVARRRKMAVDEAMIAKFALFERCTEEAEFSYLYSSINTAAGGKPHVVEKLEGMLESEDDFVAACPPAWKGCVGFLREWLALRPQLSGSDLRPLVYLSRETTPLRSYSATLSASSAEALRILTRVSNIASPTGKKAAESVPEGEHLDVIRELITSMRAHANWLNRPEGFNGAFILAEHSPEAGAQLAVFLRQLPGGQPLWLGMALKNAAWFHKGAV